MMLISGENKSNILIRILVPACSYITRFDVIVFLVGIIVKHLFSDTVRVRKC